MKKLKGLEEAFKASFTKKTLPITVLGSILAYIILVIFSFPTYMYQLLGRSLTYLPEVIFTSSLNIYDTAGLIGLPLTIIYAVLTGITLTNVTLSLKMQSFSSIKELGVFLPGFLVSGCASCGFGLLSFIGLTGVLATLPFSGNSVRLGGIIIMIGLLQKSGNPKTCSIPASS